MAKFSGTKRRPLRTNLTAPIAHHARAHASPTRAARRSRATPSRICSCSPRPTWSARTRSTSAPTTRDARFVELVHEVTATNPAFIAGADPDAGKVGLAQYLRETMLMRSAAVVMAAEYVAAGGAGGRSVVARALQRADEPAELLGYWLDPPRPQRPDAGQARHRRRGAPPLHRACRAALRRPVAPDPHGRRHRAHPPVAARRPPVGAVQVPARPSPPRRRRAPTPTVLPMLAAAAALDAVPIDERRAVLRARGPAALAEAGFSWERLSGWLPGGMDAEAWEAVIPSMGVMALVRNLRNFDQAGIARGGDRRGDRQDHRRRRGGQGAPVPVPGVGGVQARAVGQLEAGARPHARPHRRQHPGARRHPRGDRHVGLDAGDGVGPLDACSASRSPRSWRWRRPSGASNVDVVIYGQTNALVRGSPGTSVLGGVDAGGAVGRLGRSRHLRPHRHRPVVRPEAPPAGGDLHRRPAARLGPRAGSTTCRSSTPSTWRATGPSALPAGERGRYTIGGFTDATFTVMEVLEDGRNADVAVLIARCRVATPAHRSVRWAGVDGGHRPGATDGSTRVTAPAATPRARADRTRRPGRRPARSRPSARGTGHRPGRGRPG